MTDAPLLELGKPCPYCGFGSMVVDGGAAGYYCDRGWACKAPSPWSLPSPDDPKWGVNTWIKEHEAYQTKLDDKDREREAVTADLIEALRLTLKVADHGRPLTRNILRVASDALDRAFAFQDVWRSTPRKKKSSERNRYGTTKPV